MSAKDLKTGANPPVYLDLRQRRAALKAIRNSDGIGHVAAATFRKGGSWEDIAEAEVALLRGQYKVKGMTRGLRWPADVEPWRVLRQAARAAVRKRHHMEQRERDEAARLARLESWPDLNRHHETTGGGRHRQASRHGCGWDLRFYVGSWHKPHRRRGGIESGGGGPDQSIKAVGTFDVYQSLGRIAERRKVAA